MGVSPVEHNSVLHSGSAGQQAPDQTTSLAAACCTYSIARSGYITYIGCKTFMYVLLCCTTGRVKTLHPGVHGGILAIRSNPTHMEAIKQHNIQPIDLVSVKFTVRTSVL
jgi:hypothetical protein